MSEFPAVKIFSELLSDIRSRFPEVTESEIYGYKKIEIKNVKNGKTIKIHLDEDGANIEVDIANFHFDEENGVQFQNLKNEMIGLIDKIRCEEWVAYCSIKSGPDFKILNENDFISIQEIGKIKAKYPSYRISSWNGTYDEVKA
jgi:hypothetical protein